MHTNVRILKMSLEVLINAIGYPFGQFLLLVPWLLLERYVSSGGRRKTSVLWNCAVMVIFRVIWLGRNGRIFQDMRDLDHVESVKFQASLGLIISEFKDVSFCFIQQNWELQLPSQGRFLCKFNYGFFTLVLNILEQERYFIFYCSMNSCVYSLFFFYGHIAILVCFYRVSLFLCKKKKKKRCPAFESDTIQGVFGQLVHHFEYPPTLELNILFYL